MPDDAGTTPAGDGGGETPPTGGEKQETPPATGGNEGDQQQQQDQLGEAGRRALEQERTARKDAERAAKVAQRELEKLRQQSMSDAERAVAEAETRGRQTAMTEFGKRLAQSEFAAAAARRNPEFAVSEALEFVDLARFVGEDGEPDTKAITAAVERLVPEPAKGPVVPSYDGGPRTDAKTTDMNQLIRQRTRR